MDLEALAMEVVELEALAIEAMELRLNELGEIRKREGWVWVQREGPP